MLDLRVVFIAFCGMRFSKFFIPFFSVISLLFRMEFSYLFFTYAEASLVSNLVEIYVVFVNFFFFLILFLASEIYTYVGNITIL